MITRWFCKSALMAATAGCVLASASAPALADDGVDWILDMRLRAETVDMDGVANKAEAITLRTRFGFEVELGEGFSFLLEGENVTHLVDDFNDTVNGLAGYPVVADPEATELNRLQLSWSNGDGFNTRLGRQRIILGDARYIGNVGFRQNEQTFDAAVFGWAPTESVSITYAYLDRVHRIFGDDHPAGELDLDSHAFWAEFNSDAGKLTGFAILADVEDAALLSSSTLGVNWRGSFGGDGEPSWGYMLEYAHQSDHADNPLDISLDMFRAEISVAQNGLSGRLGIESLEGNGTIGFLTPLATLHKFQGWADVFLATPANGVRDIYAQVGFAFPEAPFGESLDAAFVFHDFESESGSMDLGSEIDFVVRSNLGNGFGAELKAAFYNGPSVGPADKDKIWFGVTYQR